MGCVLCNMLGCEEFLQGEEPSLKNLFYCKTERERKGVEDELAYDIASCHPDLMRKINRYHKKLKQLKGDK
mgnify:CR=1 FL=1